jgi:hypothetical protein
MKLAREQEGSCDNLEPHEQDHVEQELEEPQATASRKPMTCRCIYI